MPYKLRNSSRHKFPKTRYKITNWKEYNQALINRGPVTLHLPDNVIKAWRPKKCKHKLQGAQFKYSDIAIQTAIAIKIALHMPYRATQGFITSVFKLMKLTIPTPNYTTMCRRIANIAMPELTNLSTDKNIHVVVDATGLKIFGQGQWHEEKHGLRKPRRWRKLHLTIDRDSHAIIAQELTADDVPDDAAVTSMIRPLQQNITHFAADKAYDKSHVYKTVSDNCDSNVIVAIPPRHDAVLHEDDPEKFGIRNHNLKFIKEHGAYRWQDASDYNYRAIVETGMYRYKTLISDKLFSRKFKPQQAEARIACRVLNRLTALGMPRSVKIKRAA